MVRLSFLDGLRGLAAVYVLMFHMALVPAFKPTPPFWLKSFVLFGGTGVTLFFVVSAFSLCLTMGRHLASPSPLLSFYGSRVFRIAPLFFVLLAFSIWWLGWRFGAHTTAQSILLSVSFLFNLVLGDQTGIVWASWTISVEMLFYAAFPLLYLKLTSIQAKVSALFCAMLAAQLLPGLLLHVFGDAAAAAEYEKYSIIRHLPVFLIGMVSFDLFTALRGRENSERLSQPLIGTGALALTMLMTGSGERFPVFDPYYWQAAAYAAVLLGLSLRPLPIFVNAVTQFLGTISYSIYLIHAPIIFSLGPVYEGIYAYGQRTTLSFLACLLLTIAVVIPIAWALFLTVEKSGIKIGTAIRPRAGVKGSSLTLPS